MKKILLYFILLMAVGMAGIVAYVSVSGLLKVFTGAGTLGLMLFSAIEIAKVVATSAIHTYGKRIGWFYNILLSFMILISMAITSMGIYGFLSSSYKESFSKMENVNSQVELLEKKRDGYTQQFEILTEEKATLNQTISELTKGLSNNVIQYKDPETGQIITTTSSSTRKVLQEQLDKAIERQDVVNVKSDTLSSIIFNLENEILEVKLGDEATAELSTLQYLSDLTGMTMDEVMSWFILLLIIIGDPMAVLMVIVFNKVANYHKKDDEGESEGVTEGVKDDGPSDGPIDGPSDDESFENIDNYIKVEEKTDEPLNNEYMQQIQKNLRTGTPIQDEAVSDAVNEAVNEVEETVEEESLPPVITDEEIVKGMIEKSKSEPVQMDEPMTEDEVIDEEEVENTPEEQINENIQDVKQLTREPIIPRGEILKEDLINEDRGFSVKIPAPKTEQEKQIHFFPRKRPGELGNE